MEGNVVSAARWVGLSMVISAVVIAFGWPRQSGVPPAAPEGHRPARTDARKHRIGILLVVDPHVHAEGRELAELIRRSVAAELTGAFTRLGVAVEEIPDVQLRGHSERQPEAASQPLPEVANGLAAAWLARLTIRRLDLYEPGSLKQLLRCRVSIRVETWGIEPSSRGDCEYIVEYPKSGPVEAEEFAMPALRTRFAAQVSRELVQQLLGREDGLSTE